MRYFARCFAVLFIIFPFTIFGCGDGSSDRPSDDFVKEEIAKYYQTSSPRCEGRELDSVEIVEWGNSKEVTHLRSEGSTTVHVVRARVSVRCESGLLSEAGTKEYNPEYVFWRNSFDEWEHEKRKGFGF